jgi:uncharacterized protein (TIGR03437 family)
MSSPSYFSLAWLLAVPFLAQAQTTPPTCSVSTLTGTYSLVVSGRNVNASIALNRSYQAVGSATFDGNGNVTFLLVANTNLQQGVEQTLTGTYNLSANCVGTLNISVGDTAAYTLIAYNKGKAFSITGQNATYILTGTGGAQPVSCLNSTLSGNYVFSGNGFALSSTTISGVNSISGLLQFDGRGNITGKWSIATNGTANADTVLGNYSVNTACQATAALIDQSGASWSLNFTVTSADGADFSATGADPSIEFSATGHSTFTNPGVAIVNSASSVASGTPAGSIFALYGMNLAPSATSATKVPLPDTLLATGVTVNGESAPLFYVGPGQINAQMPWDIQPGLASVVVTSAAGVSNTAAVTVPATAVPGVFPQYPTNAAVVASAANVLITPQAPAHIGDTVVAYFTGGGPVNAVGPLVTGAYNPNGQSPVTSTMNNSVTVAGVQAVVQYIGLTGSLVGVYQVNFVIPKVAAGTRDVVLTIGGVASVVTTIPIAN